MYGYRWMNGNAIDMTKLKFEYTTPCIMNIVHSFKAGNLRIAACLLQLKTKFPINGKNITLKNQIVNREYLTPMYVYIVYLMLIK